MFGMIYFGNGFPGWSPWGIDIPYISPTVNLYIKDLTSNGTFETVEIDTDNLYIKQQDNTGSFERLQ